MKAPPMAYQSAHEELRDVNRSGWFRAAVLGAAPNATSATPKPWPSLRASFNRPDPKPIEMAFAKLRAHLRAAAARTIGDFWQAIGNICAGLPPEQCSNDFVAAGYEFT